MIRNVLQSIAGIEIYPIISLILFFTVFMVMIIWVVRRDKKYIDEMSSLPLQNRDDAMEDTEQIHIATTNQQTQ